MACKGKEVYFPYGRRKITNNNSPAFSISFTIWIILAKFVFVFRS